MPFQSRGAFVSVKKKQLANVQPEKHVGASSQHRLSVDLKTLPMYRMFVYETHEARLLTGWRTWGPETMPH